MPWGRGVPEDDTQADKWFALAAEQGQPIAQFMLGQWYRDGKGGRATELRHSLQVVHAGGR